MTEATYNNYGIQPISQFVAGGSSATAGGVTFSNSNGVSFGMNSAGVVTASAAAGGGGAAISAAGSSQNTGTVVFSNSNGVTFGMNGATVTASVAAGGGQTTGGLYALGNTTQNSSTTLALSALSFNGLGIVTMGYSNGSIQVSATQSNQAVSAAGGSSAFQTLAFTNSNNVSFSNTGGSVAGSFAVNVSAAGGTSNALSGLTFSNLNGVSFGLSTGAGVGTLTASVAAQTNQTLGFYGLGNTTQSSSTTYDARTLSFSAAGAMSVGFSNGAVQLSAPATSSIAGASGISISNAGSTLSVGIQPLTRAIFPGPLITSISAFGQGSVSIQYVPVDVPITGTRIDALMSWAAASTASAVTAAVVISAYAGIYTRNGSTLSSLSSGSTQTTYTYASNSAGQTQLITGAIRPISVPVNFLMTQGEYFAAFCMSTNSSSIGAATTNLAQSVSVMGGGQIQTALNYAEFTNQTAASTNLWGGMGVYSAQTNGIPAAISLSAIVQSGASLSEANIALVFRNA